MNLIDPTAQATEPRPLATRRPIGPDTHIGLVDAMLNPRAEWGQGMLDAAQMALPDATFDRISRTMLGDHQPMAWAKAMAALYSALVIAAGD